MCGIVIHLCYTFAFCEVSLNLTNFAHVVGEVNDISISKLTVKYQQPAKLVEEKHEAVCASVQ